MKKAFFILALYLAQVVILSAAEGPASSDFSSRVQAILSRQNVPVGDLGIEIVSLETGKRLSSTSSERLFSVASNNKIVTTAAALHFLGPSYTFRTEVLLDGKPDREGSLSGRLVVKGTGDPNISGRFFDGDPLAPMRLVAGKLKKSGLKRLVGPIVADDTFFDRVYLHPNWKESNLAYWYSAETSALSFNDNRIDITLVPQEDGEPPQVILSPPTSYVTIENSCRTTSNPKGPGPSFSRKPGSNIISIRGSCFKKAGSTTHSVTVHEPALYFATALREELVREGIEIVGEVRTIESGESLPHGPPAVILTSNLAETIYVSNKRSQNFYAEQILKLLGRLRRGEGSFQAGAKVVEEFLNYVGIPRGTYSYVDGSGLSPNNRFSPSQIASVLEFMHSHRYGQTFLDSLAIGGVDGTLRRRWKKSPLKGNVVAKTGSIEGAHALSGYLRNKNGERFAFSILYNRSTGKSLPIRQLEEEILTLLYETNSP